MTIDDEYRTIKKRSKGQFKDRGSKFIAVACQVETADKALEFIDEVKKEYHDARHHCYAYKLGTDDNQWRVNDDGEPSGSAGNPILGQIRSFKLTNIVIVVVRYFGGTLLGVGGLINAYRSASKDALNNSTIIKRYLTEIYLIKFPYSRMNSIMTIIKENSIDQIDQNFALSCKIAIRFKKSQEESIISLFDGMDDVEYELQ